MHDHSNTIWASFCGIITAFIQLLQIEANVSIANMLIKVFVAGIFGGIGGAIGKLIIDHVWRKYIKRKTVNKQP